MTHGVNEQVKANVHTYRTAQVVIPVEIRFIQHIAQTGRCRRRGRLRLKQAHIQRRRRNRRLGPVLEIKNTPKKTQKKHLKNPLKMFFVFVFIFMKIIQRFFFETDFF
jgi:hypothetical protein